MRENGWSKSCWLYHPALFATSALRYSFDDGWPQQLAGHCRVADFAKCLLTLIQSFSDQHWLALSLYVPKTCQIGLASCLVCTIECLVPASTQQCATNTVSSETVGSHVSEHSAGILPMPMHLHIHWLTAIHEWNVHNYALQVPIALWHTILQVWCIVLHVWHAIISYTYTRLCYTWTQRQPRYAVTYVSRNNTTVSEHSILHPWELYQ